MSTYEYLVTFKKNGEQTYDYVRAQSKEDACVSVSLIHGDVSIISVSVHGN